MKRHLIGIIFCSAFILLLAPLCYWQISSFVKNRCYYYVDVDPFFCAQYRKIIKKQLRDHAAERLLFDTKSAQQMLKGIYCVEMMRTHLERALINVQAQRPLYCLNEQVILTDKNNLFECSLYDPYVIATVPHIFVSESSDQRPLISGALLYALHYLPAEVYQNYTVCWHNKTDAWLYSKRNKTIAIRFNVYALPTEKIIETCTTLIKDLIAKKIKGYRQGYYLVADIRFANQIIIYVKKEGWGDGTTIK